MNLNELTSKELSIISEAIADQIDSVQTQIKIAEQYIPARMLEDVTRKDREAIPVLREFHVQLLTAKKKVRESEVINEN